MTTKTSLKISLNQAELDSVAVAVHARINRLGEINYDWINEPTRQGVLAARDEEIERLRNVHERMLKRLEGGR